MSHIGLAVGDIEKSVADLSRVLAIPRPPIEDNKARQTKVAFVDLGGVNWSSRRVTATRASRRRRKDILADIAILKQRGVKFRDEQPRVGLTKKWISYTANDTIGGLGFELRSPNPEPPSRSRRDRSPGRYLGNGASPGVLPGGSGVRATFSTIEMNE